MGTPRSPRKSGQRLSPVNQKDHFSGHGEMPVTPRSIDPATGKRLPRGVECRGPRQYRARRMVDGVHLRRTFDTAREADAWLRCIDHLDIPEPEPPAETLATLLDRFKREEMRADGHRRGADKDIGHLNAIRNDAELSALAAETVTRQQVRAFRDRQIAKGLAPATVVKRLNLLAAILNHAVREWDLEIAKNPAAADAVSRPRGADKKRDRRLQPAPGPESKSEEMLLIGAVTNPDHPWDAWLTKWAIAQAMRLGESLALQLRDIDLKNRTVKVYGRNRRGQKNERHRDQEGPEIRPLMPEAVAILNALPKGVGKPVPTNPVFPVGRQEAFSIRFARAVAKAGIDNLTYHDLRHEATSRLALIFPNPLDLKRVTGHKDLKSLDRYYQPDMAALAAHAARIAAE